MTEKINSDVEHLLSNPIVHQEIEELSYRFAEKIEKILTKVVEDNPNIPFTDMILRYNLNYAPVDVITRDGDLLYSFEKEYENDFREYYDVLQKYGINSAKKLDQVLFNQRVW